MIKFYIGEENREVEAKRNDITLFENLNEVSIAGLIIHLTNKQMAILKDRIISYDNGEDNG